MKSRKPIAARLEDTALASPSGRKYFVDLSLGFENLMMHKLRSLLTMLGMIFGVAAVIAMLSIGAGARAQVMALIEQMGVRNVIVEAREASAWEDMEKVRKVSMGLTLRDFRVIQSNVTGVVQGTPRKRFTPGRMIPKPQHDMPVVYGVVAELPEHRQPQSGGRALL